MVESTTVKATHYGYSTYFKRHVEAYEFFGIDGYFEKGIFIPLSNIDESEMERLNRITTVL
jgi:hypothetical protein